MTLHRNLWLRQLIDRRPTLVLVKIGLVGVWAWMSWAPSGALLILRLGLREIVLGRVGAGASGIRVMGVPESGLEKLTCLVEPWALAGRSSVGEDLGRVTRVSGVFGGRRKGGVGVQTSGLDPS